MHDVKTAHRIRVQLERFSGKLSHGLPKVGRRLVREVLYGVQARGSVRLSEIARALGETTALKKVIERLGRQLGRPGLRQRVQENLLQEASRFVGEDSLLVIDPTDVTKPYARRMEYLGTVRDGSTKRIGPGYGCMTVVAARRGTAEIVPLYQELYSQESPEFESESHEILRAIRAVAEVTGERGLWVMDRGGDRRRILVPLLRARRRFLIRLRGDRHLLVNGQSRSAFEIAASSRLHYRETVVRQEPGGEQIWPLHFGARSVRLPDRPTVPLYLVIVEGPWKEPLVLLTTERPGRSRRSHWRLVESYFARWRVEESIRFIKQSYQLEDIRLLRYDRLRTLVTLVLAAAYFAAVHLGKRAKLRLLTHHVLRSGKRIYGVPEFRFYGIADGIKQLFFSSRRGLPPPMAPIQPQFSLLPLTG